MKLFRILKDWDIQIVRDTNLQGYISIDMKNKQAIIYSYPEKDPDDFYFHEVLHIAFGELLSRDRRKKKELIKLEEELIQDLCAIYKVLLARSMKDNY